MFIGHFKFSDGKAFMAIGNHGAPYKNKVHVEIVENDKQATASLTVSEARQMAHLLLMLAEQCDGAAQEWRQA